MVKRLAESAAIALIDLYQRTRWIWPLSAAQWVLWRFDVLGYREETKQKASGPAPF